MKQMLLTIVVRLLSGTGCLRFALGILLVLGPLHAGAQVLRGMVAAGEYHSLAIRADGTLWATGHNGYGQLGDGTTTNRATWVQVGTATDWVQVAAGSVHSLGLRANGQLYAWGSNGAGELGFAAVTGSGFANPTPVQVPGTYAQVAAGGAHSLALTANGTLWTWGSNQYGQLGRPGNAGTLAANPVPGTVVGTYTQVVGSVGHTLALQADGTLWAWGNNLYGQLGRTGNNGTTAPNPTPTAVAGTYTQVSAGSTHSLALRADGTLWAWGANGTGQLGVATNVTSGSANPVPLQVAGTYTRISAGYNHSLALQADGSAWAWGRDGDGQLGAVPTTGPPFGNATPRALPGLYAQVVGGGWHSLGLQADGTLRAWGSNFYGELGNSINLGTSTPNFVPAATGTALVTRSTAAGFDFGLAIRGDGALLAWGSNQYGQLGNGTLVGTTRPALVGTAHDWVQVVAGQNHALALKADGRLYAWGADGYGQLGQGSVTTGSSRVPVQVPGTYTQVAAGYNFALALKADGTLWGWGHNYYGQLASPTNNYTLTANPTPVQIPGTFTQMAAGYNHSLGLRPNGTVLAWGSNQDGQLGNSSYYGAMVANPTPLAVAGTQYRQVAAGGWHSLALRDDGTLYAWGINGHGQLGQGNATMPNSYVPLAVPGTYTQAAAGYRHSLALRADGTLWSWGYNLDGELGQGPNAAAGVLAPAQEATAYAGWTTLASSSAAFLSFARTASAQSFASTGANNMGQLGDGTTTPSTRFDRLSPLTSLQPLPVRAAASNSASLLLVPNPAHGAVQVLGAPAGAPLTVYDALGRLVRPAAPTLDVAGLPAGIYLVRTGKLAARLVVE